MWTHHILIPQCHILKCNAGVVAKRWRKVITRSNAQNPIKYKFCCKEDNPEKLDIDINSLIIYYADTLF
jgi:hypothetical protein